MTFIILVYSGVLYLLLFSRLSSLKIPVLIYSAAITLMLIASLDIARRRYNNSDKYLVFHHVTRENGGFQKLQFVSERISYESGFDSCPKSLKP